MGSKPKWLDKPKKDYQKDEADWAKRRGGRKQVNSGRHWFSKMDVKDDEFLTDCKETERLSFTIRRADWEELQRRAIIEGLAPCLKIKFVRSGAKPIEVVVIPSSYLERT